MSTVKSLEAQYQIATQIAGVKDNAVVELSIQERLEKLRVLEEGWDTLHIDFWKTSFVDYSQDIKNLTEGVLLLGDSAELQMQQLIKQVRGIGVGRKDWLWEPVTRELNACILPSQEVEKVTWKKIAIDGTVRILDTALAIYDHDLMVVLTVWVHSSYFFVRRRSQSISQETKRFV